MRPWWTSGRLLPGLTLQRLLTQGPAVQLQNKTMNAGTAEHVGIQKLKRFHMESIKELLGVTSQSCNTRQRALGSLPANGALNSDQVISLIKPDGENESVHPGPGQQHQASSSKQQASSVKLKETQASSGKHQAPSTKVQAPSRKRQAPGSWSLEKVSRYPDQGPLPR